MRDVKALEIKQALRSQVDVRMTGATSELGENVTKGAQAYFKVESLREYSPWWALTKLDVMVLWNELKNAKRDGEHESRIANRKTRECQKLVNWLADRSESTVVRARALQHRLTRGGAVAVRNDPRKLHKKSATPNLPSPISSFSKDI